MVQAMLCGEEGLFILSPAPAGRLSTQRPQRELFFWSDSLIPLKSGTGIPDQNNHQSLTGPMV